MLTHLTHIYLLQHKDATFLFVAHFVDYTERTLTKFAQKLIVFNSTHLI